MIAYRITHKLYGRDLKPSGREGRWNGSGRKVIYCADSIALAFLENMVRRQGVGFNRDFVTMIIEFPDNLSVQTINEKDLAHGWRDFKDYGTCQTIGNKWFDEEEELVLKVPSAILPEQNIFVLNTLHPDFKKVKIRAITEFIPDERIENLLKAGKLKL